MKALWTKRVGALAGLLLLAGLVFAQNTEKAMPLNGLWKVITLQIKQTVGGAVRAQITHDGTNVVVNDTVSAPGFTTTGDSDSANVTATTKVTTPLVIGPAATKLMLKPGALANGGVELYSVGGKVMDVTTGAVAVTGTHAVSGKATVGGVFSLVTSAADVLAAATTIATTKGVTFITGSTAITGATITPWTAGTIQVWCNVGGDGTGPVVTDGNNLVMAGNLTLGPNDCLTWVSDGTNLIEIARSVN